MDLKFVFEDLNYVIVDKTSGVLSVPGRFQEKDQRDVLGLELQKKLGLQIFPVHRLDFEVSGLVMFAKNAKAHAQANHWFEHKLVQKTYRALTSGPMLSHLPLEVRVKAKVAEAQIGQELIWKSLLLKGKKRAYTHPQGKPSETWARCMGKSSEGYHQWDLRPITGRSHQLRVELSQRGYPIVGDKLYGSDVDYKPEAIALQAYKLEFLENQLPTIEIPTLF